MTFQNIRLILAREIRDQRRDRRTMFMIFVLPILLYPLLGMSYLQLSQFIEERATSVWVVGARGLEGLPPLVENDRFAEGLFDQPQRARLLRLDFAPAEPRPDDEVAAADPVGHARRLVQSGAYDAALVIPPDFDQRLERLRQAMRQRALRAEAAPGEAHGQDARATQGQDAPATQDEALRVASPEIIYNTASEKSLVAYARLSEVLGRWTEQIGAKNLEAGGLPAVASRPFQFQKADVADEAGLRGAATWAKLLPMLLVLWAMTGAFYPAVDLCAGEKERGTLETLLSSPARRSEIVLGKLATVMLFSMATAVLNLVSMGVTGWVALAKLPGFGPPPLLSVVWLALALVPVSALFSALCLALAAFARSSKEGQYYLMPLMLVTMPLVVLPMTPSVELNLGTSLVPVTGAALLLRGAIEGNYWQALQYLPVVAAVTLACCLLAIRWAVDQFNSESVLFRESEQADVRLWLRHLARDRQATPTAAAAVFCGALILAVRYFLGMALPEPTGLSGFAAIILATQLVVVAAPALLMTALLTTSPARTLQWRRPPWTALPAAALLAVALHPLVLLLQKVVVGLYPPTEQAIQQLTRWQDMILAAPPGQKALFLLVVALTPAVCEELAFRGFILSGLRRLGRKWRAIFFSALLFGFTHGILQQSLIASLVGAVIGYVAIQSGSVFPGMVYHAIHNALPFLTASLGAETIERLPWLRLLIEPAEGGGYAFTWPVVAVSAVAAVGILRWFAALDYPRSPEELVEEALRCEQAAAAPAD
jgi:sodium transport system permease protein